MKNLIIKADRLVLDTLTQYVRRWIARHEYKKHAVDFMIVFWWVQFWALVVWAIVLPAALYIIAGHVFAAAAHVFAWSFIAAFEWFDIQHTKRVLKPQHDMLFKLREHEEYSKMHAEVLEEVFVKTRRQRLTATAMIIGITATLFVVAHFATNDASNNLVWQFLLVNAIASRIKQYLLFVNDFEPPKKKKRAAEAIGELLERLWGEMTAGFAPQPQPAFQKI